MKKIFLTILSIIIVLCSTLIAFANGGSISAGEGVPAGSRFSPNAVSLDGYAIVSSKDIVLYEDEISYYYDLMNM